MPCSCKGRPAILPVPASAASRRKGKFDFNDEVWTAVSADAKDMIRQLLLVEPAKRLTLDQVFEHPWCKTAASEKRELLKVRAPGLWTASAWDAGRAACATWMAECRVRPRAPLARRP